MRLKDLTLTNFMSIRQTVVEFTNQGLMLIQGNNVDSPAFDSNGAGKSTMFEGLTWVLFDETVRGLSADEVVNNSIGKNCSAVLNFDDDLGNVYRITRYRKHSEFKNAVKIFKNGDNITPKSAKDTNKLIVDLFGLDFPTFTNSILFGQGLVKMFSVASDSEKKDILERMLQIDIFRKCLDIAKSKRKEIELDLTSVSTMKQQQDFKLQTTLSNLATWENMETQHRIETHQEIGRLSGLLKEAKAEEETYVSDTAEATVRLDTLREELTEINNSLKKFKDYEMALVEMKSELGDEGRQMRRKEREIVDLKAEAGKIASGEGSVCPTCGAEIAEDEEAIEQSIRHIYTKIKELQKEVDKHKTEIQEIGTDMEKVEEFLKQKNPLLEKVDELQKEIYEVQAVIKAEADTKKRLANRVEELKDAIARKEMDLEKTYKPLIEKGEKEVEEIQEQITKLAETEMELRARLDLAKFWVESYGNQGVKSYLLDSVTPFLNKRANEYLSKLAGNTVEIEFSTQTRLASGEIRDKFEVRILNTIGGGTYKSNSQGERRRIDLAIALALQDLVMSRGNGKLNVLVYDEIFDSLDAIGCENAIQLLQEMSKRVETIYVITHNDILKSFFDRQLTVTKKDGVTTIEVG